MKIKVILCVCVFVQVFAVIGCKLQKQNIHTSVPNLKLTQVSVFDYSELAGCGFVFKMVDESFLIPLNMPDSLKHHGLKLQIAFEHKNVAGTCMAGPIIQLNYARYHK